MMICSQTVDAQLVRTASEAAGKSSKPVSYGPQACPGHISCISILL